MILQPLDVKFFGYEMRDFSFKFLSEDILTCYEFIFFLSTPTELRLEYFYDMRKKTKRHNFRVVRKYSRRLERDASLIKLKDVPFTDEIKQVALKTYMEYIQQHAKITGVEK